MTGAQHARIKVQRPAEADIDPPDFQTFWQGGVFRIDPRTVPPQTFTLERCRAGPQGAPSPTPSGKVENLSQKIASFDLPDWTGCRLLPPQPRLQPETHPQDHGDA